MIRCCGCVPQHTHTHLLQPQQLLLLLLLLLVVVVVTGECIKR
jgi:hypothetical protein